MQKINFYLLCTLASITSVGLAGNSEQLKERMEKVAALSDAELNAAYFSASSALIKDGYDFEKAEYAFGKCKDRHPQDQATACESLNKRVSEMWNDRSAIEVFGDIVYEKHQRKLYDGFVGRGSGSEIIGRKKVENGKADLYRAEQNLQDISWQALFEKRKKTEERLQGFAKKRNLDSFDINCMDRNSMKMLAIERELEARLNSVK